MRIGALRHRLTFQAQSETRNDFDESVPVWTDKFTIWGSVEPLVGKWYFESKQLNQDVDGKIRIRYRTDVEPSMRIIHKGRILEIVSLYTVKEIIHEIIIMYKEKIG